MNGDKHIAKENDKMDKIKEEINEVFEGKLKTKLEYATNEFPEDFDRIYNKFTKAFETKYEPYPYQKQASVLIDSIYGEHRECPQSNILIASPTGSGKTFAIKWAAYRALKNGERLIVAVPLVALAEQIYFELRKLLSDTPIEPEFDDSMYANDFDYYDEYDDYYTSSYIGGSSHSSCNTDSEESAVGIRTGPSEKFPDAPILVCTYEVVLIQMNQNYRFLDRCPLIIIDEVHMISDPHRGHIPENIMNHPNMPYGTKICGLSGTLPNSFELAEFIGRTNRTETRIIGAKKRPISLDYYIHTGEKCWSNGRKSTTKITDDGEGGDGGGEGGEGGDSGGDGDDYTVFHKVYNSEDKVFDEEKWEEISSHKTSDYINANQMKTRVLDLIDELRKNQKLPAMIVGFSCKRLNTLSTYLNSINLCENKKCSSMVHIEFSKLQKRIPPEEWVLFERFKELAKRGIGVHHSQNPKHYLEILPKLVKKGYIKVIFATSTLSAGIDLPVRTVVLTDLIMPSEKGFRLIETNLFHQICGRAGRPGLETQGNVVILKWKKIKNGLKQVSIQDLITTPPAPVTSKYRLTPSTILNILSKDDPDRIINTLVLQSFATRSQTNISSLVVRCMKITKEKQSDELQHLIESMRLLEEIRNDAETYISVVWKDLKRKFRPKQIVYVDPDRGEIKPLKTTVNRVDNEWLHTEHGRFNIRWILYVENLSFKKMNIQTFDVYKRVKRNIDKLRDMDIVSSEKNYNHARDIMELERCMSVLKDKISPETSTLYEEYQKQLDVLKANDFVTKNEVPTLKGKMAAGVLSTDDPLTLIEFITQNSFEHSELIPLLTCFLRQKKNNDPPGPSSYRKIVTIQKNMWKLKNETLGTTMIEPMRLWMSGHSVSHIVENCDISVGHFCKEALRMKELLSQLSDTCAKVGNVELEQICRTQNEKLQRGLPFLQSSFLK